MFLTPLNPFDDSWKPKLSAASRGDEPCVLNESPVAVTCVATACAASTSPTPPRTRFCPTTLSGSAVDTSADATSLAFHCGWAWTASAATPATCGEAIEVPE